MRSSAPCWSSVACFRHEALDLFRVESKSPGERGGDALAWGTRRPASAFFLLLLLLTTCPALAQQARLTVGAKRFTEGVILGELMAQVLERHAGVRVRRSFHLGGTQLAYGALRSGEIDMYAEYTGTGLRSVLHDRISRLSPAQALLRVGSAMQRRDGVIWLAPFGFDNTYALVMRSDRAQQLGIRKISDLPHHRELVFGLSHEFLRRGDGLPGLKRVYRLAPQTIGLEHDLAYRALAEGKVDVTDGYSTDAKLSAEGLIQLQDDLAFFPPYEAAPVVREEVLRRFPRVASALALLAGRINAATMQRLNYEVEALRKSHHQVAARFLRRLGLSTEQRVESGRPTGFWRLFWHRRWSTLQLTGRHLLLAGVAVLAACLLGIPLGIAVYRRPRWAALAVGGAGVLQTIPSIALLAFMLPLFGVGVRPAIVALFLYGLLPIVRNTVTGLRGVDQRLIEVGRGLGMRRRQVLWRVELPMVAPVILAGVRTSMVINIGTATLAAFIGAGGLGEPIVTGLSVTDSDLVLCGALPAAALALIVDWLLGALERRATPKGMRLESVAA